MDRFVILRDMSRKFIAVIFLTVMACGPMTPNETRQRPKMQSAQLKTSARVPPTRSHTKPVGRKQKIVAAHNVVRAKHCAPPLVWSDKIAAVAQKWAAALRDDQCSFEHNPSGRYGENLAFFSPAETGTAEAVVRSWYKEVDQYDFRAPGFSASTGHFSQLVWVETTLLGCGVAMCRGGILWVCNYHTPGNVVGTFGTNVLPTTCSRK